ncbi:hypothetical protein [Methylocapsa sp. S129]|uniref:hypothetical protein n=1 Tax=Methylocapsa sp. S129 TaxID=1641869 RepID=UPI00131D26F7|nr:hypothetical protein [Methylocapsa sp. S129]
MRTIILAGSTALILALGVSSVYANGPLYSPYEILAPKYPDATPAPAPMPEGRAAYTNEGRNGGVYAPLQDNIVNTYGAPQSDAERWHAR